MFQLFWLLSLFPPCFRLLKQSLFLCSQAGFGLLKDIEQEKPSDAMLEELDISPEQIQEVSEKIEDELDVVRTLIE